LFHSIFSLFSLLFSFLSFIFQTSIWWLLLLLILLFLLNVVHYFLNTIAMFIVTAIFNFVQILDIQVILFNTSIDLNSSIFGLYLNLLFVRFLHLFSVFLLIFWNFLWLRSPGFSDLSIIISNIAFRSLFLRQKIILISALFFNNFMAILSWISLSRFQESALICHLES